MNPAGETEMEPDDLATAQQLVLVANFAQAELYLRRYLSNGGAAIPALDLLKVIARGYGVSPSFHLCELQAPSFSAKPKYLLIKAWGYGFLSDVHHVLGQLLLAELTHRTPIVRWGSNSLFRDETDDDAYARYFIPPSPVTLEDLPSSLTIYPPKWTYSNLVQEDVNKRTGPFSHLAAQFMFDRDEDLVVSDYFMPVATLMPWIAPDSAYYGKSDDDIYIELFEKYLKPQPSIQKSVDAFFNQRMLGKHWIAVHVRGSDKVIETEEMRLAEINSKYFSYLDRIIELNSGIGIFLMTDSIDLHDVFKTRYTDRLISTAALRSDTSTGVHYQGHPGNRVGTEILVDTLLATRCDYFVGNIESNVSLAVTSIKRWPHGFAFSMGSLNFRGENTYLYAHEPDDVGRCRLCQSAVEFSFSKKVLGRHIVNYHRCTGCGALQTDQPYWLGEAYVGPAERFDTGKASRTLANFLLLPQLLSTLGVHKADMAVDFGGGTGLLARLMRDAGYNFHTCDKFGSSEFMGGFAWTDINHRCRLVTMFEVAEHFADPTAEWSRIFACDPDWIVGSTNLYTEQGEDWAYLSPESGQHIFFYSAESIAHLARQAGRFAYQLDMYFLITRSPLDESVLASLKQWQSNSYSVCKLGFDSWIRSPYKHADEDNAEVVAYSNLRRSGQRIAVDGLFLRFISGIALVWKRLLTHWSASDLAENLLVIDRGRSAPRLPGLSYVDVTHYDFANPEDDRKMLQAICDQEHVSLFISTYYSTPLTTPSALLVLDMIPEVLGYDLNLIQWSTKRKAIEYARFYVSISESTEQDLIHFYPAVQNAPRAITYPGCDFRTASSEKIRAFATKFDIRRPYFLIVGERGFQKNALLFFQAFARLGALRSQYAVVCTMANGALESEFAVHMGAAHVHMVVLNDDEMQCAYSGAVALAYPSRYEGFGLPVVEAMACSCPVITCRNSSLPEVGAESVIYVDPDSIDQMHQALLDVQNPSVRAELVARGLRQAEKFSWAHMARQFGQKLANWATA